MPASAPPQPQPQPQAPSLPKPSFETVIQGQSTSGFWDSSQASVLARCIAGSDAEDTAVKEALA